MAKISPYVFFQELNDNNNLLSGGLLYTYEAGTTTPKATYTDAGELTTNPNPIVLDAYGRADVWLGSGAYKFILKDSSGVTIKSVDNITGDATNVFGSSIIPLSTNTNITSVYQNSIVECTNSITLTLLSASVAEEGFCFSVKNTGSGVITIDPDASETINGASTFSLYAGQSALISCDGVNWLTVFNDVLSLQTNNNWVGVNTFTGTTDFQGIVKVTGKQIQLSKGADVASATALPILTDGNFFDVTGTTTITSIATSGKVGTQIKLQFDGVLTLTHHATDLILPTGANITTAAGDVAEFVEYASGDWVCTNYERASGKALKETGITLGTMQTAAGGETAFDFTSIPSGVKKIIIMFDNVSTNGSNNFLVQIGDSGGLETTGYGSAGSIIDSSPNIVSSTIGFVIGNQAAGTAMSGHMILTLMNSGTFKWISSHNLSGEPSVSVMTGAGSKSLSDTLDRLRITTAGATNTFDAGSVFNISYEY